MGHNNPVTFDPSVDPHEKHYKPKKTVAQCKAMLRAQCVANPLSWNKMQLYNIEKGGTNVSAKTFTDFTAEFLLTRGPL